MNQDQNNITDLERIERYLEGNMPEEERKAFEQEMKSDPKLSADVASYRAINFSIANKDYVNLKNDILQAKEVIEDIRENVRVDYQAEAKQEKSASADSETPGASIFETIKQLLFPTQPAFKLALVAAVLAVLLIPSYVIFYGGPDSEQLFADNFNPYPNTITSSRSDTGLVATDIYKAMQLYEKRDYTNALDKFNDYLATDPAQYDIMFYRGITNLQLGNIEHAVTDLEQVMDNNRSLENQAKWYLALLYLKDRQLEDAAKILKEIEDGHGAYSEKAKEIRKKLKD